KPAKKIYATGNGKCNLTNLFLDSSCYHAGEGDGDVPKVMEMLGRFSREDLLGLFSRMGVPVHSRDGYVYPRTDQAETVARALEKEMGRLGIRILTRRQVLRIDPAENAAGKKGRNNASDHTGDSRRFCIQTALSAAPASPSGKKNARAAGRTETAKELSFFDAVILCTGGLAGPSFGCAGDGYRFAGAFSHKIVPPLPALTQLVTDDPLIRRAAGVRCHASVLLLQDESASASACSTAYESVCETTCGTSFHPGCETTIPETAYRAGRAAPDGDEAGPLTAADAAMIESAGGGIREEGELQITDYGISGIPVFQLSGRAARLLSQGRQLSVRIDFLPEIDRLRYAQIVEERLLEDRGQMLGDLLLGLAHRKVIDLLLARYSLQAEMKARRLSDNQLRRLLWTLRDFELPITSVRSFEHAQVTCGGVPLREVTDSLESRFCPGLYLAGELLDVDGRCGGYNLQWAMTSGVIAGRAAAGLPAAGTTGSGGAHP
ncbi:MAG: NAD(P)/FAD-dependent oxidoreductase, partial [Eubacteriales bacterium]|nr:NAD(P)/FAD-dependent oxidoreductase [Eubacteriales bacterium]